LALRTRIGAAPFAKWRTSPKAKRVEFRPPDPTANSYLAFAAMMMAGLDGIQNRIEADHDFLLKGGVFTEDLIETWIEYKRKEEADQVRLRPHPWEFALYYDS
jgi:glutamine synthetase